MRQITLLSLLICVSSPNVLLAQRTESIEVLPEEMTTTEALKDFQRSVEGYRVDLAKYKMGTEAFTSNAEGLCSSLEGVGVMHHLLGQYREAISAYTEALEECKELLGRDRPELQWKRAKAYNQAGEHSRAAADLESILKVQREADWLYELAVSYKDLRRTGDAIRLFQEVLEVRPDDYNSALHLANLLRDQGRHEEAAEAYRKAVSLASDTEVLGTLYYNLGTEYMKACRKEEAKAAFEEAIKINLKYSAARPYLARYRCKEPKPQ